MYSVGEQEELRSLAEKMHAGFDYAIQWEQGVHIGCSVYCCGGRACPLKNKVVDPEWLIDG